MRTTIVLSKETKTRLGNIGTTNQTYEAVVIKLLDFYEDLNIMEKKG